MRYEVNAVMNICMVCPRAVRIENIVADSGTTSSGQREHGQAFSLRNVSDLSREHQHDASDEVTATQLAKAPGEQTILGL